MASGRADYLLELWLAGGAAGAELGRRLQAVGVEAHLFGLLTHIAHREPVAPSVIAAEEGIPVTTIRDNVQRLVDRGYVRRLPNPDDGRSYLLVSTPAGAAMLEAGGVVVAGLYRTLRPTLPRTESEYGDVLRELRAGLARAAAEVGADGSRALPAGPGVNPR